VGVSSSTYLIEDKEQAGAELCQAQFKLASFPVLKLRSSSIKNLLMSYSVEICLRLSSI
jgi:hypothetical protein